MKINLLLVVICIGTLCIADSVSAQDSRGVGRGGASSWLGLLRMNSIQKEIELVPDQDQQIKQLQKDMWREMQEQMKDVRGLEPDERREQFALLRERMEERQVEYQQKIESVLLPMQVKRLRELQVQSQARRSGDGAVGVLKNAEILKELGIDSEQKQKLEEKAKEVREKLEEKIKEMRAKAEEEILSVLTKEQRTQLRGMIGETFDFNSTRDGGSRRFERNSGRGGQEESKD